MSEPSYHFDQNGVVWTQDASGAWSHFSGDQWVPAGPPPPGFLVGPAPAPDVPGAKPAKRKTWPWIVGGVVLLFIILGVIGAATKPKTVAARSATSTTVNAPARTTSTTRPPKTTLPPAPKTTTTRAATTTTPPAPKATTTTRPVTTATTPASQIGQTVKDGDFAFTVTSFQCGTPADTAVEGSDGIGETIPPGAQECMATVNVSNDKSTSQTFFASAQYAYDTAGKQISSDTNGIIYVSNSNDDTQVSPGVTITALVPFQIASTDQITKLVLHDSEFSNGVSVRL